METSLCNIYAPNDHADQLRFIEDLNNYLIEKSELTTLIIGGGWNCTLTKKDKKVACLNYNGYFWSWDIQRVKHSNINKYYYKSKALIMRSRIDFFLIAKNLTKYV